MKNDLCYIIIPKSTAARLQKAIANDKQLASVAEQIKKQEPAIDRLLLVEHYSS